MAGILSLLAAAAAEGHDEARLHAEVIARLVALRPYLPPAPLIPRRVHERLLHPERLDVVRIDGALIAIAEVIGPEDGALWAELVALNLAAARLGATVCTHRLGRHVIAALRATRSPRGRRVPGASRRRPPLG